MSQDLAELVRDLYPFDLSIVSDDADRFYETAAKYLDFQEYVVPSGSQLNGWVVPDNWKALKAEIWYQGELMIDCAQHPLGVGRLSPSFSGQISRDELLEHLFFSDSNPNAIPYHWSNLYRPGDIDWALCVTKRFVESLPNGDFFVELVTEHRPGYMRVLDFFLPGDQPETLLLNAHNCHPWQANDDISGCAIGIATMMELKKKPVRNYSYRLVVAPELVGPVFWLASMASSALKSFGGALLLKALGSRGPLKLQHSFKGNTQIDTVSAAVLRASGADFEEGPFRTIYGNDETAFDAPGYAIPSVTLTRNSTAEPFDGYHTSEDTPDRLDEDSLYDSARVVRDIVELFDQNQNLKFLKDGLVALSHPNYNLYRAAPAPGLDPPGQPSEPLQAKWNYFMNCAPRELDGSNSIADLALRYGLPPLDVANYLLKWQQAGLVEEVAR